MFSDRKKESGKSLIHKTEDQENEAGDRKILILAQKEIEGLKQARLFGALQKYSNSLI